ncbi:prepilin-type N-terminal cleavage/methylation domain-containing protein [Rugamonas sp.]|uniref:prepilin-type N-terminal cleavage/methylation domain-containing protein n=1 Tax=Rugamonas sp. TaxID=1926287 RepID=UPI0025E86764|nr:prepilin-type N-terminal cleavage/methylation domain-containing protein [Rugamonas sp.]
MRASTRIHSQRRRGQRGFTLVEMIIVMVITSVIAGTMVLFIRAPVQNYVDSAARADMSDVAELAMRRLSRELRRALPNSLRVLPDGAGGYLLEFIPTTAGGRYLSVNDGYPSATYPALGPAGATVTADDPSFRMVGPLPATAIAVDGSNYIVVYNLGAGYANADAYAGNDISAINKVVPGTNVISVNAVGGNSVIADNSPTQRFNVVTSPVTYSCKPNAVTGKGTLTRYWNYGFKPTQTDPSTLGAASALLADKVSACYFDATSMAYTHTGMVSLSISLRTPNSSDPDLRLFNQIHMDNTP